jgi:hypothetical protein
MEPRPLSRMSRKWPGRLLCLGLVGQLLDWNRRFLDLHRANSARIRSAPIHAILFSTALQCTRPAVDAALFTSRGARSLCSNMYNHTIHFFSLFAHLSPSQNIIAKHGRLWIHSQLPEKPLHSIASTTTLTIILDSTIITHADLRL